VETLQLFPGRADEHVSHEESMVGSGADDSDPDPVLLIPSRIAVHHVDAVSGVEVVHSSLSVDFPDLSRFHMLAPVIKCLCAAMPGDIKGGQWGGTGKAGCRMRGRRALARLQWSGALGVGMEGLRYDDSKAPQQSQG
jgi:hypothetical protein